MTSWEKPTLLLADDQQSVLTVLSHVFEYADFRAIAAKTGVRLLTGTTRRGTEEFQKTTRYSSRRPATHVTDIVGCGGRVHKFGFLSKSGNNSSHSMVQQLALVGRVLSRKAGGRSCRAIVRKLPISLLAIGVFFALPIIAQAQTSKTYNVIQITDGTDGFPKFGFPNGITADADGNLYVADEQNSAIRKITPTGEVSTLAGKLGVSGYADGTGPTARFRHPVGITLTGGALYVTDFQDSVIRKVTLDGTVTTVAGAAVQPGTADGPGLTARFKQPYGITADSSGNLYVTDSGNFTIRKISPNGDVTTIAGLPGAQGNVDGSASISRFYGPGGIACARDGTLYVGDNCAVRMISPSGEVTTFAGAAGIYGDADGVGTVARFQAIASLALDAQGTLYVADPFIARVRTIDLHGTVSTLAGGADSVRWRPDDYGTNAWFSAPNGVTVAPSGEIFVSDSGNRTIRKIDSSRYVSTFAGVHGLVGAVDGIGGTMPLSYVTGVCVDQGRNLYFIDSGRRVLQKLGPNGGLSTIAGDMGYWGLDDGVGSAALFRTPSPLKIDPQGNLYTIEQSDRLVRRISPSGVVTTVAKGVSFPNIQALTVDLAGNVYIADEIQAGSIRKLSPNGVVTPVASPPLDVVRGIAIDPARNLYVSLWTNDQIVRIGADGKATLAATLSRPLSLALDDAGFLYAVYNDGEDVARISPTGSIERLITSGGGPLVTNRILRDLSVDKEGSIFLAPNHGYASDEHEWIVKATPQSSGTSGPSLLEEPVDANLQTGEQLWLSIRTTGALPLTVQWYKDGTAIPGATSAVYAVGSVTTGIAGSYTAVVTNANGAVTSRASRVAVSAGAIPVITENPVDQTIRLTQDAVFTVEATGASLTYQWEMSTDNGATWKNVQNSAGFSGANIASLAVLAPTTGFLLRCRVTNSTGSVTSSAATLVVITNVPRLVNIATRAYCASGNNVTIGGFVVSGSGSKQVFIRAIGPTLATLGLASSDVLANPVIEVHRGSEIIAINDNWGDNPNASEIVSVGARIGANPIATSDVTSSAMLLLLPKGVYTFVVKGKNETAGIVLLEVYDADMNNSGATMVNIACRADAVTGNGVAIGGFVIGGGAPKQVLMRAVGPTLATQGLAKTEVLLDPTIELHRGSTTLATNDNWGDNANRSDIVTTGARIGAAAFAVDDTRSAALLMTLDPGVYTFIAAGKNNTSGIVLVEIYDAD
jgi:sugar lactone lactonase YvrE